MGETMKKEFTPRSKAARKRQQKVKGRLDKAAAKYGKGHGTNLKKSQMRAAGHG